MRLTRQRIHQQVYFYALILLAVSLPLSIFTASASQFILAINWIAEGRFREKWKRIRFSRALWVFLSLYLLHVIALLWSSDIAYSMHDLKVKLPLLVFPLIIASSTPITRIQVNRILFFFILGIFAGSVASVFALLGWIPVEVNGFRDLSVFVNHIRFSLMIVVAILVVVWFLFIQKDANSRFERGVYLAGLIWFPAILVLLKSLSGILILGFLAFFILVRAVFEIRDAAIRFMALVPVIMLPLFSIIYVGHAINTYYSYDNIDFNEIDSRTVKGNLYLNQPKLKEVENGHYVWMYVCDKELEEEWNKISEFDYHGRTTNGNSLRTTLIRFLASKGLRKDAEGLKQLTEEEVRGIERGIANHIYLQRFRVYPRIYEVIWEIDRYRMSGNPNEKSVVQRYLYLEAGWNIARKNLLKGVGTGDVELEFINYYNETNSPLDSKLRRRTHNQFLTFLISFGIPGLVIGMIALVLPIFLTGRHRSFLCIGFFILVLLSMMSEDTLETSTGVTMVAFFYTVFVFGPDFPWLGRTLFRRNVE